MLVPQDTPCPDCGHPRRDHEIPPEHFVESCVHCGCSATMVFNGIVLDPDAEPTPFDWRGALVTFVMWPNDESLFTDSIEKWQPGYELQPGERDELREVELLVRDLWKRYAPKKPGLAVLTARSVAEENAAVDRYEDEATRLKTAILRLAVTDEWRTYFPAAEHERLERVRHIIIAHGGDMVDW